MPKFIFYAYIDLVKEIQLLSQKQKEDSAKELEQTKQDNDEG